MVPGTAVNCVRVIDMRRLLLTGAVLLVNVTVVLAQGSSGEKFTEDASLTFETLAGQARLGFFGIRSVFEDTVKKSHLTKTKGDQISGTPKGAFDQWWATWEGQNASGHVIAYAGVPNILDRKRNLFWVRFDFGYDETGRERDAGTPMPEALLSHLLGKARETAVSSGDTLTLKLPFESVLGGCTESYTLRIRMTTGALVSNTVEDDCPVK